MVDLIFPPGITIARNRFRYVDSTGVSRNPYTGTARTASRGGDRVGCSMDTAPAGGGSSTSQRDRAQLLAFIAGMRGKQNRAYLWDHSYRIRGSFPASELLSNNTFASGTTGWTPSDTSYGTGSVEDSVWRTSIIKHVDTSWDAIRRASMFTVPQYSPIVGRISIGGNATGNRLLRHRAASSSGIGDSATIDAPGFLTVAVVPYDTTGNLALNCTSVGTDPWAGQYITVPWISCSQCALVDASPNSLTYAEQFDNGAWTKARSSISANSTTAPDGSTTADSLIEDSTASNSHLAAQTATKAAATEDWTAVLYAKANTRTQVRIVIGDNGSNWADVFVNLSTGAILSGPNATGTVASSRASVTSVGNGWYRISLTALMPSSMTTSNQLAIYLANGGTSSYTGNGSSGIYIWRAGYAKSGAPFLPMQTTSAADSDGTPYTMFANGMNLKGLPASTAGLLLPGDWFEVITSYGSELKMCTASLNSDASGCGYLQFSPPLRGSASDNAAVIFQQPMGRFIFAGDVMEWMTDPGIVSAASFEWEEAVG